MDLLVLRRALLLHEQHGVFVNTHYFRGDDESLNIICWFHNELVKSNCWHMHVFVKICMRLYGIMGRNRNHILLQRGSSCMYWGSERKLRETSCIKRDEEYVYKVFQYYPVDTYVETIYPKYNEYQTHAILVPNLL